MRLLAMVEEPANVARFLAAMSEPTRCPAAHRGAVPVLEEPAIEPAGEVVRRFGDVMRTAH